MPNNQIDVQQLKEYCSNLFVAMGMRQEDAPLAADVLVAANVRGIHSHGVGRILRWVNCVKSGLVIPDAQMDVIQETQTSIVIDGNGGFGAPIAVKTMQRVIDKAEISGVAFGAVRNSNHFGIAGYYAMMALPHDMLGFTMTNTPALAVPTFGRNVMFGTNPIAFAAPADKEKAFVLDMSTTVAARGKIELYDRKGEDIPLGWAVDKTGQPTSKTGPLLDDMFHRRGGGILPLGGAGEAFGGHKGFGLAMMVDILCATLSGGPMGSEISDTDTSKRLGHFFGAIKIDRFRDPKAFRQDMDRLLQSLRETPPAEGEERVYFAGLKEYEAEEKVNACGLDLPEKARNLLIQMGEEYGVTPPF